MDAVLVDINGNKKNYLYQYDKGQYLIIENFEYSIAPEVHFQIKSVATAVSMQSTLVGTTLKCLIPNQLLAYGEDIIAYIYIEDGSKESVIDTVFISVIARKRPSDYIDISSIAWDNVSDKPELFSPEKHSFTHSINGTDTISPEDIGAASQVELEEIKSQVEEISSFIKQIENADTKFY